MADIYHTPVLLQPVCSFLKPEKGKKFLDATVGGGGHTKSLIEHGAQVLGIDQDENAINHVKSDVALQPALAARQLILEHGNFIHSHELLKKNNFLPVDGVLIDLGVSSHQFDEADRGFSFRYQAPLDMRMDMSSPISASDLINILSPKDLAIILKDYGEINGSAKLAEKIIAAKPIQTTDQLAKLVPVNLQPQVFQALRIAVNDELGALNFILDSILDDVKPSGVIAIISFHSLEDRIVKDTFIQWEEQKRGEKLTPKPVTPSPEEIETNPRSRSSKLRVFQKI